MSRFFICKLIQDRSFVKCFFSVFSDGIEESTAIVFAMLFEAELESMKSNADIRFPIDSICYEVDHVIAVINCRCHFVVAWQLG